MPNGKIVYHTDSAWDYFRTKAFEEELRHFRRGQWFSYDYNETHRVEQHSITNEFVFKPIPIITRRWNQTHYEKINQLENTSEYVAFAPQTPDYVTIPLLILLGILFYLHYLFSQQTPAKKKKAPRRN